MRIGQQIVITAAGLELMALFSLASCSAPRESAPQGPGSGVPARFASELPQDPIVTVGHGVAILPDGRGEEAPSPEFVREAQHYYIDTLLRQAKPEVQAQFEQMTRQEPESVSAELRENHAAIGWLLDRVKTEDRARLRSINAFLLRASGAETTESGLGSQQQALLRYTNSSGPDYMQECVNAGVPKPPPWGSQEWVWRGKLERTLLTQLSGLTTNVYTFQNEAGVCFALPRTELVSRDPEPPTEIIRLLGVICQSAETSHACFWDAADLPPPPPEAPYDIEQVFKAGTTLTDTCTQCHRGENAFIIHPNTPLDIGEERLIAKGWMRPIVPVDWPQNHRPSRDLDGVRPATGELSCGICHSKAQRRRLPAIDALYCAGVLLTDLDPAIGWMPAALPGAPANQTMTQRRVKYATHIAAIEELCRARQAEQDRKLNDLRNGVLAADEPRFDVDGWQPLSANAARGALFGDFNDDGRSDSLQLSADGEVQVATAGVSGFGPSRSWQITIPEGARAAAAGDFDGDGNDDLLIVPATGGEALVAYSNVAAFMDPEGTSVQLQPGAQVVVGDVNNDRLDDLVSVSAGPSATIDVYLSTKNAFAPSRSTVIDVGAASARVIAGDVDGDYLLDLIFVPTDGGPTTLAIGTRSGFESVRFDAGIPGGLRPERAHLGDVNDDGLDDLVAIGEDGRVAVSLSAGTRFDPAPDWRAPKVPGRAFVADVNGDGRADLVSAETSAIRVALSRK